MVCTFCNRPVTEDSMFCLACGGLVETAHDEVVHGFIEELVERGNSAYREKRYEDAIAEFERVLELTPDDADIHETVTALKDEYNGIQDTLERARSLLTQHKYEEAKIEALQILDMAPGYREAENVVAQATRSISEFEDAVSSGKKYLETRRFEEAIEKFHLAMTINPQAGEVARLKKSAEGSLSVWEGEIERIKKLRDDYAFGDAISFAERMIQKRPFDENLQSLLSEIKTAVQTLEESRAAGEKALKEERWAEAEKAFKRVLSIVPKDAQARKKRDKAVIEAAKARAARTRRMIKIGALGAVGLIILIFVIVGLTNRSHFNWGKEYMRLGKPLKALREFEKADGFMVSSKELADYKRKAGYQAFLSQGHTARLKKDWGEARAKYNEAGGFVPDTKEVNGLIELVNLLEALEAAHLLAEADKFPEAIDAVKAVTEKLATCKDMPEAARVRAQAREATNSFRLKWLEKARNLLASEKFLPAGVQLRKIAAKCPGDRDTMSLLTQCRNTWLEHIEYLREEGKWEEALLELQAMTVSFSGDQEIAQQFRGTKAKRRLEKSHALFRQKKYHPALEAALEAEQNARGIAGIEEEVAKLLGSINGAIDAKYNLYMTKARELIKADNLKEAKTQLAQALLFRRTKEATALAQEVDGRLAAPEGMVYVLAGPCIIGDSTHALWKSEGPAHNVDLPAYYIDKHPVTNAQYKKFVKATGHRMPAHWVEAGNRIPRGKENYPVTHVDISDAMAYAQWSGRRLPTEKEWEKAARGPKGLKYPWGNKYETGMANDERARRGGTSPVGAFPHAKSTYGCLDMAGNVWEWTGTKFYLYPGHGGKLDPDEEKLYVVKGGCFVDDELFLRSSFRETVDPNSSYAARTTLGFRCAADVKR